MSSVRFFTDEDVLPLNLPASHGLYYQEVARSAAISVMLS
jgi:hypothetical protein